MVTNISHSPAETEALGKSWGRHVPKGLAIGLSGDLGAGKTRLVRGIALGLGITERVHSPTFTLVNVYATGRLTLFHLDLYRLETPEQIFTAGLDEYLNPAGVAVIEWGERLFKTAGAISRASATATAFPKNFRRVEIEIISETERRISYEDFSD